MYVRDRYLFFLWCFHTQNVQISVLYITCLCFPLSLSLERQFSYKQKRYWITENKQNSNTNWLYTKFIMCVFVAFVCEFIVWMHMRMYLCFYASMCVEVRWQHTGVGSLLPLVLLPCGLKLLSANTLLYEAVFLAPYNFSFSL